MIKINSYPLRIPLKHSFKHASAKRSCSESIIVEVLKNGITGLGEGCPRPYVTGETVESGLEWINKKKDGIARECLTIERLKDWVYENNKEIDENPAAWCAVELGLLDYLAKEKNKTVEELLEIGDSYKEYKFTAVVGDAGYEETAKVLKKYISLGFNDYKFKISGNIDIDNGKFQILRNAIEDSKTDVRVRIDANNIWSENFNSAVEYFNKLNDQIFAVEEPLAPRDYEGLERLSKKFDLPVIYDESVCNSDDLERVLTRQNKSIINVRVSKMGGIIRTLDLIKKIISSGFGIIVGCQVGETSILSRAGLIAANASGKNLIAQEGCYGTHLLDYDFVDPVIMFGHKGIYELKKNEKNERDWIAGLGLIKSKTTI